MPERQRLFVAIGFPRKKGKPAQQNEDRTACVHPNGVWHVSGWRQDKQRESIEAGACPRSFEQDAPTMPYAVA